MAAERPCCQIIVAKAACTASMPVMLQLSVWLRGLGPRQEPPKRSQISFVTTLPITILRTFVAARLQAQAKQQGQQQQQRLALVGHHHCPQVDWGKGGLPQVRGNEGGRCSQQRFFWALERWNCIVATKFCQPLLFSQRV